MTSLIGIDSGLTVTKAVVFDIDGTQLSVARRNVPQSQPRPHHVERDMSALWRTTADAIAEAVALSGRPASDIAAIAATAHGDGVYLLDADRRPLRPGILSLDSRAAAVVSAWAGSTAEAALALTGQQPHAAAPAALLAWIKANEPACYDRIAHVLACKDWLRFCLTGTIGTDVTEASTSFCDVRTQRYAAEALRIFGLEALENALPAVSGPADIIGHVTPEAAASTGLRASTPVAAGLHDVVASALGIGSHTPGVVAVVAGTYSINETISTAPVVNARWFCRNGIEKGTWNHMAISPASTANYDWFLQSLCQADLRAAEAAGKSVHTAIAAEIDAAMTRRSSVLFHPYLYGSPLGPDASASFLGLRGWHDRGDLLRAVLEGIVFNHRVHVDALRERFAIGEARLTGGVSRNPAFAQLFADVLQMPVTTSRTEEAAAWGAALCAGAAAGIYASPLSDPRDLASLSRTYQPDLPRSRNYESRYRLHCRVAETLSALWPEIEGLAS